MTTPTPGREPVRLSAAAVARLAEVARGVEDKVGSGPVGAAHPIVGMLAVAVPLWAHRMTDWPLERILDGREIERLQGALWSAGEAILFRVPGRSAEGFNAVAEALARLAYLPGGVCAFGMRFEYAPGEWLKGKHGVAEGRRERPAPVRGPKSPASET